MKHRCCEQEMKFCCLFFNEFKLKYLQENNELRYQTILATCCLQVDNTELNELLSVCLSTTELPHIKWVHDTKITHIEKKSQTYS